MIKIMLAFDGTEEDFQKNMEADENFDLVDSIYYAINYCQRGEETYHNNIQITVKEED